MQVKRKTGNVSQQFDPKYKKLKLFLILIIKNEITTFEIYA